MMTLDKYTYFLKNRRFWENQNKWTIFHVNVHFRCSDFNQKLAVLLLAYIELQFRISKLWDLWLRNAGGGYIRTYILTDQWIFGLFLASGDYHFWLYVLNPVSNYYGHRFLPPKKFQNEINYFHFWDTSSQRVATQRGHRNTFLLYSIENKYESKNIIDCFYYTR